MNIQILRQIISKNHFKLPSSVETCINFSSSTSKQPVKKRNTIKNKFKFQSNFQRSTHPEVNSNFDILSSNSFPDVSEGRFDGECFSSREYVSGELLQGERKSLQRNSK